jgi:hypothetical protein
MEQPAAKQTVVERLDAERPAKEQRPEVYGGSRAEAGKDGGEKVAQLSALRSMTTQCALYWAGISLSGYGAMAVKPCAR